MLDWLKPILGEHYTAEIESKVSQEIGKGFVAKADHNAKIAELTQVKASLTAHEAQLEELKKATGTAEELTAQISALQVQNKKDKAAHDAEITALRLDTAVDKIARDAEYTVINGGYQEATNANVANKTRGMIELCGAGTTIAAGGAVLTLDMLKALYKEMADAGAAFGNMVAFCNSHQKQGITSLYEKQVGYNTPASRTVGGMSIKTIENDFFVMGIVYDPFMPADTILVADVAQIAPVFQEVPGKGVLFLEDLAKTGAADRKQIYGQLGLAHGPAFLHATITGLAAGA